MRIVMIVAALTLWLAGGRADASWKGRGSGGWGPDGEYGRAFDPSSAETVRGVVRRVEPIVHKRGMSRGIHLVLKTAQEELPVHLGPEWFLERQDFEVNAGDELTISGSRIEFEGKPALIASELQKGDATLRLRDAQGYPAWAGWRRGRRSGPDGSR